MSFVVVPVPGQTLGSSRDQVQTNFNILRSTLAENHVDVNSANPGVHTHADLLAQASDPNPATTLISHYSKAVSGITEWFLQRENSGAVFQMSAGDPTNSGVFPSSVGQTFLPGGFILQWGSISKFTGSAGTQTFTLNTPFPNAGLVGFTSNSGTNPSINIAVTNVTTTQMSLAWSATGGAFTIFWFALGR